MRSTKTKIEVSMALAAALGSMNALGGGSVVFDNTLPNQPHGTTTTVPLVSGTYSINAANTGYLSGTNLFESFATFIVAGGETASFTNSTNLNIGSPASARRTVCSRPPSTATWSRRLRARISGSSIRRA